MTWIQTYSGVEFSLEQPQPEDVRAVDIGHALANLCRYTGHTTVFYSVAEHSVLLARQLAPSEQLAGLLHDAAEAYVNDLARPLKELLPREGGYRGLECRIWHAIATHFELDTELPTEVKEADLRMLATERCQIMAPSVRPWVLPEPPYDDVRIEGWPPHWARQEWMAMLGGLLYQRQRYREMEDTSE